MHPTTRTLVLVLAVGGLALVAGTVSAQSTATPSEASADNATVSVGIGQQLSTVVAATDAEVRAEYENRAFEMEYEQSGTAERPEVVAQRARELADRARALQRDYENATRAYERGELTRDEYAQRLATLHVRAETLAESADELRESGENETRLEVEGTGLDAAEFERTIDGLDTLRGPGQRSLLRRFTGVSDGEIELRTANGLELSVEGDDGESSREVRRPGDDSTALTVSQSTARDAARRVLSTGVGNWTLVGSSVHDEDGEYRFEYALHAANTTGEAEIRVDGSAGTVVRIEEEIEPRGDADEDVVEFDGDDSADDESDDLSLTVVSGTPAANATITIEVTRNGEPVADATVLLNDAQVAVTDARGRASITLSGAESEVTVEMEDDDAELDYEFAADSDVETENADDESGDDTAVDTTAGDLQLSGTHSSGTVTLTLSYAGSPVSNVAVSVESDAVGETDASGEVSFPAPAAESFDVELVSGDYEVDVTYRIDDGTLVATSFETDGNATATFA